MKRLKEIKIVRKLIHGRAEDREKRKGLEKS